MRGGEQWAVEIEGFAKAYAGDWRGAPVPAVSGLSLRLAAGQVLGLLGPNGSGKSTTLKALAGLVRPSAGRCRVLGHAAGSDAARAAIGYLPETVRFVTHQTARELLQYCASLSSMPAGRARERIQTVLEWTGLGDAADRRLATYSKGMRQRLGLAQAVLHEPAVILLDEPTAGLDPEGRLAVVRLVRELAGQGRTVVLTSHLLAQAEDVCDRLALIGAGRLLAEGTVAEVLGRFNLPAAGPSPLETAYLNKLHGRS
jgi:ABC-type multidrug transport system ATPase subunit